MRRLLLPALLAVAGCGTSPATTAPAQPARLDIQGLADYLNGQGVKVAVVPLPMGNPPDVQVALLRGEGATEPSVVVYWYADGKGVDEQLKELGGGAFGYNHFAIGLHRPNPSDDDRALLSRVRLALKVRGP